MVWTLGASIALVLSAGIGFSLGLVGSGGSILAVPVLVYVAGVPPHEAIALSLAIVGATAAAGAIASLQHGNVHVKAAAVFSATGMGGALAGSRLTHLLAPPVLMVLFAALMVIVAARTLAGPQSQEDCKAACNLKPCVIAGLGVGVLTGFLGVGGGFLIVPALARFAHMPIRQAVGTSLLIIAANSAAGLVAHWDDLHNSLLLAIPFTVAALTGLGLGWVASQRLQSQSLRTAFGGLALAVSLYLFAANLQPLGLLLTKSF